MYHEYKYAGLYINNPATPYNIVTPGTPVRCVTPIDRCERRRIWLGVPTGNCPGNTRLIPEGAGLRGCGMRRNRLGWNRY